MRILVRLGDVETGASITKRSGEKLYRVERQIRVFPLNGLAGMKKVIRPNQGSVFLMSGTDFNEASGDNLVLLNVDRADIEVKIVEDLQTSRFLKEGDEDGE